MREPSKMRLLYFAIAICQLHWSLTFFELFFPTNMTRAVIVHGTSKKEGKKRNEKK